jgi:mono/diheme cytochrome c family protein
MQLFHTLNRRTALSLAVVAFSSILGACSNFPSRQPPIQIWLDMKKQAKYKAQAESQFFADGRSSRRPMEGTVSQESYRPDEAYSTGLNADNTYVARNPEPITPELLKLGQTKFNIYCAPCHDRTGSGRGIVPSKAVWVPGNMHDERIVNFVDGELYHVISNGRRSMPAYRYQVGEKDRWAIVAYIRALQRTQRGTMQDVPADLQAKVR